MQSFAAERSLTRRWKCGSDNNSEGGRQAWNDSNGTDYGESTASALPASALPFSASAGLD